MLCRACVFPRDSCLPTSARRIDASILFLFFVLYPCALPKLIWKIKCASSPSTPHQRHCGGSHWCPALRCWFMVTGRLLPRWQPLPPCFVVLGFIIMRSPCHPLYARAVKNFKLSPARKPYKTQDYVRWSKLSKSFVWILAACQEGLKTVSAVAFVSFSDFISILFFFSGRLFFLFLFILFSSFLSAFDEYDATLTVEFDPNSLTTFYSFVLFVQFKSFCQTNALLMWYWSSTESVRLLSSLNTSKSHW